MMVFGGCVLGVCGEGMTEILTLNLKFKGLHGPKMYSIKLF